MTEKTRQHKRIDKTISLLYCVVDDLPHKWDMSVIENISVGGLRFIAPSDLKLKDKTVRLRIKIPELAPHLLELEAMVVNIKPRFKGKQSDVSVKFIDLSEINKGHLSVVEKMIELQESKKKKI